MKTITIQLEPHTSIRLAAIAKNFNINPNILAKGLFYAAIQNLPKLQKSTPAIEPKK